MDIKGILDAILVDISRAVNTTLTIPLDLFGITVED